MKRNITNGGLDLSRQSGWMEETKATVSVGTISLNFNYSL
jgi:hypothetical protein